jgi:hypothetical protein
VVPTFLRNILHLPSVYRSVELGCGTLIDEEWKDQVMEEKKITTHPPDESPIPGDRRWNLSGPVGTRNS